MFTGMSWLAKALAWMCTVFGISVTSYVMDLDFLLLQQNLSLALLILLFIIFLTLITWKHTQFLNFIRSRRRQAVGFCLLLIPLVGSTSYDPSPTNEIIVIVAKFDSPDPQTYRVRDEIFDRLDDEFKDNNQVNIIAVDEVFESGDDRRVRRYGRLRRAAIVIWGGYGDTSTARKNINFEVLQPLEEPPGQPDEYFGGSQLFNFEELDSFTLQTRVGTDIAFLTHFAVGLANLTSSNGQSWNEAQELINRGIDSLSEAITALEGQETNLDLSFAYYHRGRAKEILGEISMGDYYKAVEYNPDLVNAHARLALIHYNFALFDRFATQVFLNSFTGSTSMESSPGGQFALQELEYHVGEVIRIDDLNGEYDPDIHTLEAGIHLLRSNYDTYLTKISEIRRLDPDSSAPHMHYGSSLLLLVSAQNPLLFGQVNERFGAFDLYLANMWLTDSSLPEYIKPEFVHYFDSMESILARAVGEFDLAISKEPGIPIFHSQRGTAYSLLGLHEEAVADFELALQISDGTPTDFIGLPSDIKQSVSDRLAHSLGQTQLVDRNKRAYINELREENRNFLDNDIYISTSLYDILNSPETQSESLRLLEERSELFQEAIRLSGQLGMIRAARELNEGMMTWNETQLELFEGAETRFELLEVLQRESEFTEMLSAQFELLEGAETEAEFSERVEVMLELLEDLYE